MCYGATLNFFMISQDSNNLLDRLGQNKNLELDMYMIMKVQHVELSTSDKDTIPNPRYKT